MRKIYLAGPDVFLPDAVAVGRRKKELCAEYGFEGLYPFDNEVIANLQGERIDRLIYRANETMMRSADMGIFNLTPFRGPSADPGTVFELGTLVGLGKLVFGYTNVTSNLLDRTLSSDTIIDSIRSDWRDANGMAIENFGNADNLMIDNSLIEHGGYAIVRTQTRPDELFEDLGGFEICLQHALKAVSNSAESPQVTARPSRPVVGPFLSRLMRR
jgi:nucleoside 2-deoxyribosyltransferase